MDQGANISKNSNSGLSRRFAYILFAIVALYSVSKGLKHKQVSDFYTLWDASRNFWLGTDMYFREGLRPFSYPPFSAFILSFFTFPFLPSKTAAIAFAVVEAALMVGCIGISASLVRRALGRAVSSGALLLTLLFTASFFINTINLLQANLILLLLTLMFIKLYIEGRDVPAAMFLAMAIMFKILPGLYIIWLMVRGRKKALFWTFGFLAIFFLAVLVVRGTEQGIRDHMQFKENLSLFMQTTKEETVKISKNISIRALAFETIERQPEGSWLKTSKGLVLNTISLLCLVLYVLWLLALRQRGQAVAPDLFGSLLVIPLAATTTESHHMVIIFLPLLYLLVGLRGRPHMAKWYRVLIGICLIVAFCSNDIVGRDAVNWLSSHGLYVLHPAAILCVLVFFSLRNKMGTDAGKT